MNTQMAYLLGMILGNGEIQRERTETKITIEIPYKNLKDDSNLDVAIYVNASLIDIKSVIEPLIGIRMIVENTKHATRLSFTKSNEDYLIREIMRFVNNGTHHSSMEMDSALFSITREEKRELLRGIADVTGHIRKSNIAYGDKTHHRVYIEVPKNWKMVIYISNLLKDLDIPVQTIDFGHPNFRDGNLSKYKSGNKNFWKKEHQIKIYANEFLPIGFNIKNKQKALEEYSEELLKNLSEEKTHKFYWEKSRRTRIKKVHPCEQDSELPQEIRGKHYDAWQDLAEDLGYGK